MKFLTTDFRFIGQQPVTCATLLWKIIVFKKCLFLLLLRFVVNGIFLAALTGNK